MKKFEKLDQDRKFLFEGMSNEEIKECLKPCKHPESSVQHLKGGITFCKECNTYNPK